MLDFCAMLCYNMCMETKYKIEFGHFDGAKWMTEWYRPFLEFGLAKDYISSFSAELCGVNKQLYIDGKLNIRMVDMDEERPKIFHYITPTHPNVSLPSKEK